MAAFPALLTCKGRLGIRQVTPNATSNTLVKAKALVALTTFWICRSRGFFFFSPLLRESCHMGLQGLEKHIWLQQPIT